MTDAELIKSKIDIVDFVSDYITLKKTGRNFSALCPFHSEKSPSFIVSPERQTWHCFGACGEGGDVIKFLQKWESLDFVEALKILAKKAGVKLSNFIPTEESKKKEKLFEINHLSSEFYHYILTTHKMGKRAMEYLIERGLNKQMIDTFMIGYSPASWESLLKFLQKKGYSLPDLFTAGLVVRSREGKYYDRFRGRLMFTLKDQYGNIVGFSGRKLPDDAGGSSLSDKQDAKYINTSDTPVYSKGNTLYGLDVTHDAIKKKKEAVIVEGEFDMLLSYQSGVTNVVAIKGSALTENQTLLLKRYTENIILGLDSDFAGNEASKRGIEVLENSGVSVRVVQFPYGKDPAECVAKGAHLWKEAVVQSVPIYDFIIENAFKKYESEGVIGKKKIAAEVLPFVGKIGNPIIYSHYVKSLAKKLDVTEESIEISVRDIKKKQKINTDFSVFVPQKVVGNTVEFFFLSLLIQNEDPRNAVSQIENIVKPADFIEPVIRKIMELFYPYTKAHEKFVLKDFDYILTPEIEVVFNKAFLADINNILSNRELYQKELMVKALEIKKNALRRKVVELSTKIRLNEEKNEDVADLNQELKSKIQEIVQIEKNLYNSRSGYGKTKNTFIS